MRLKIVHAQESEQARLSVVLRCTALSRDYTLIGGSRYTGRELTDMGKLYTGASVDGRVVLEVAGQGPFKRRLFADRPPPEQVNVTTPELMPNRIEKAPFVPTWAGPLLDALAEIWVRTSTPRPFWPTGFRPMSESRPRGGWPKPKTGLRNPFRP